MILLDSLYINNSGGKILLDYLVSECEHQKLDIFYLFDARCSNDYQYVPEDRKVYLKASLRARHSFYKKNKKKYRSVLCFGNIPPSIRLKAKVYTYFHQTFFLSINVDVSILVRIRLTVKKQVLNLLKNNTDYWLVQSELIKEALGNRYRVGEKQILTLPFYPVIKPDGNNYTREKYSYVYVSSAAPHKNQRNLIEAFCSFYDEYKVGKLTLTVSDDFIETGMLITELIEKGYPITNLGFVKRDSLYKIYRENEYLIFPSLSESFGLSLVEAIDHGCKVIASDLPYLHEVCKPSLVFDPTEIISIKKAITKSFKENLQTSEAKVSNRVNDLIAQLR